MTSKLHALAVAALLASTSLHAQLISTFGNSATKDGALWSYDPGTSTLSGIEGLGYSLFGTSLASGISLDSQISLTGNATVAPFSIFTITLEDFSGRVATAQFAWTSFLGGASVSSPFNFVQTDFDFGNIVSWSLDSAGSDQLVTASFSSLEATAVPEPGTWAAGIGVLLALSVAHRRLRRAA